MYLTVTSMTILCMYIVCTTTSRKSRVFHVNILHWNSISDLRWTVIIALQIGILNSILVMKWPVISLGYHGHWCFPKQNLNYRKYFKIYDVVRPGTESPPFARSRDNSVTAALRYNTLVRQPTPGGENTESSLHHSVHTRTSTTT